MLGAAGFEPKLRVMGLFGCTHKTIAMGIPLIGAIFGGCSDCNVGLYYLPLLVWHPMQLLIGSALTARLSAWVDAQTPTQPDPATVPNA